MKTCGQFKDDVGQIGSVLSDMCRVTWRLRSSAPKFSFDMTSDVNTVKLSGKDWLGHHVLFREVVWSQPCKKHVFVIIVQVLVHILKTSSGVLFTFKRVGGFGQFKRQLIFWQ